MTAVANVLNAQFARLQASYSGASLEPQGDGTAWVTIPGLVTSPAWNQERATVRFVVPVGYPAAAPDCFWVEHPFTLKSGAPPLNTGAQPPFPGLLWFSYHVQSWAPPNITLLTYVGVIRQRLNAGN